MNRTFSFLGLGLLVASAALVLDAASQESPSAGPPMYDVTVTNLTAGQVFAPALVATHFRSASVFDAGEPASPELATLAEEGDAAPLAALLSGTSGFSGVNVGTGVIAPGGSETIRVLAHGGADRLSLAGMLVTTNDTFAGLDSVELPRGGRRTYYALGWDAGSEANSEACAWIPGPPCGSHAHDPSPAEGFVHVSRGIQGHGDVDPVSYDWRGPVAQVEVRRVR